MAWVEKLEDGLRVREASVRGAEGCWEVEGSWVLDLFFSERTRWEVG